MALKIPSSPGAGLTRCAAFGLASAMACYASAVGAEEPSRSSLLDRPHTVAEVEAGIIALPTAPIGAGQQSVPFATIGRGDATVQTGIHVLYRGGRDWAVGAGALFAPRPTSDDQYGGLSGLRRSHARSYLFLGVEGRYVPVHLEWLEAWVGLTVGGVVVADRFSTEGPPVPKILGTEVVTVRSEGFGIGLQIGASWLLAERWAAGLAIRGDRWLLPNRPACTPIGDCATLQGTVEAFEVGLQLGYRIPL